MVEIGLLVVWFLAGACFVSVYRPDLRKETWAALLNCAIWPVGLVMWPVHVLRRRKRERKRQARITEGVRSGKYKPEQAREMFHWKSEDGR